ncbi:hypothetical protein BJ987_000778 [Nocardia goodfellowii]|uniref:Uncharacterized protein n=1 Tax=Nocardia goodfellowii TaxID=882446 RepID=A0ABS4Q868_9NOCA|nr:hypothetical protein [Nocardia goodfellowii]
MPTRRLGQSQVARSPATPTTRFRQIRAEQPSAYIGRSGRAAVVVPAFVRGIHSGSTALGSTTSTERPCCRGDAVHPPVSAGWWSPTRTGGRCRTPPAAGIRTVADRPSRSAVVVPAFGVPNRSGSTRLGRTTSTPGGRSWRFHVVHPPASVGWPTPPAARVRTCGGRPSQALLAALPFVPAHRFRLLRPAVETSALAGRLRSSVTVAPSFLPGDGPDPALPAARNPEPAGRLRSVPTVARPFVPGDRGVPAWPDETMPVSAG